MRRNEKEIADRQAIDSIISRSRVCRLGLIVEGRPYVVPMCFGYDGSAVLLHMAKDGKKIAGLEHGAHVCIEFDIPGDVMQSSKACSWTMSYESVIAHGPVEILQALADKRLALAKIMNQYGGGNTDWSFPENVIRNMLILKVPLKEITGKASPAVQSAGTHRTNANVVSGPPVEE